MAEPAVPEAATGVSAGAEPVVRPHLPLALVVAVTL